MVDKFTIDNWKVPFGFGVKKLVVEKSGGKMFMVEMSGVEKFMVEQSRVENSLFAWGWNDRG